MPLLSHASWVLWLTNSVNLETSQEFGKNVFFPEFLTEQHPSVGYASKFPTNQLVLLFAHASQHTGEKQKKTSNIATLPHCLQTHPPLFLASPSPPKKKLLRIVFFSPGTICCIPDSSPRGGRPVSNSCEGGENMDLSQWASVKVRVFHLGFHLDVFSPNPCR